MLFYEVWRYGPAKSRPVPALVGPTNSGKTFMLAPIRKIFRQDELAESPAAGSYALEPWLGAAVKVFFLDVLLRGSRGSAPVAPRTRRIGLNSTLSGNCKWAVPTEVRSRVAWNWRKC